MVAMEIIVTMATERVINISQYKAAAVNRGEKPDIGWSVTILW